MECTVVLYWNRNQAKHVSISLFVYPFIPSLKVGSAGSAKPLIKWRIVWHWCHWAITIPGSELLGFANCGCIPLSETNNADNPYAWIAKTPHSRKIVDCEVCIGSVSMVNYLESASVTTRKCFTLKQSCKVYISEHLPSVGPACTCPVLAQPFPQMRYNRAGDSCLVWQCLQWLRSSSKCWSFPGCLITLLTTLFILIIIPGWLSRIQFSRI